MTGSTSVGDGPTQFNYASLLFVRSEEGQNVEIEKKSFNFRDCSYLVNVIYIQIFGEFHSCHIFSDFLLLSSKSRIVTCIFFRPPRLVSQALQGESVQRHVVRYLLATSQSHKTKNDLVVYVMKLIY